MENDVYCRKLAKIAQPLKIKHRDLFLKYQNKSRPLTSEINFSNLIIWTDFYRPYFFETNGCICVLACPPHINKFFALPPIGAGDHLEALKETINIFEKLEEPFIMRRVAKSLALKAENFALKIKEDRDHFDYVYLTESISSLGGRRMHQKKNHYNYFIRSFPFEYLKLTKELIPEVKMVQKAWMKTKVEQLGAEQLLFEDEAVNLALEHFEELNLWGACIRVEDKIEAFTFGEPLNDDTFVVHIEKANFEIRGLYVAMASHFAREIPQQYLYLNREQDMGLPGLRRAKESYKPQLMIEKYILTKS